MTFALIGCGRISFKHIEGFVKNADRVKLAATCDPLTDRAEKRAADYREAMSTEVAPRRFTPTTRSCWRR
jgi:predicted dehydrogenase